MRFTRTLLAAAFAAVFSASASAAPIIVRVQAAAQPDASSAEPAVSADGKTIVFTSVAGNLAGANVGNLYSYDVLGDSVRSLTTNIDGQAYAPAVSADGRYIAFETTDNELGDGIGTGAGNDILRLDTQTGTFLRASRALNPATPASASSRNPAISGDGRYVVFTSQANNLVVPAPTGNLIQVYEMDMETRVVTMVSRAGDGTQGNSDALPLQNNAMSRDGRLLVFATDATNLTSVNNGNVSDAILRRIDRNTGAVTFENLNRSIAGANGTLSSSVPSISSNGRYVVFLSSADNLLPGGRSGSRFYVRDLVANTLRGLPLPDGMGACSRGRIDDDGDAVLFCQPQPPATAQQLFRVPAVGAPTLLSKSFVDNGLGNGRTGENFSLSADGRMLVADSAASNLIPDDTNNTTDVFMIAEPELFDELFRNGFE